jgi:glycosyltransferase involved in cell wall biosynthesis
MNSRRVLVLRTTGSFVALRDEQCLTKRYGVRTFHVKMGGPLTLLRNQITMFLWLVWNLPRSSGVFFRFADYHAALPAAFCRLFKKKLWIVLGGYDSHWFPEYNYGVYGSRLRAAFVRYAIRNATTLLPVHDSLYDGVNSYAFEPPRSVGVKTLVPGIRGEVQVLYNGFDPGFWSPDPSITKEPIVVTVATVPHLSSLAARSRMARLKGLPLIAEVASLMSDVTFVVVGVDTAALPDELLPLPANVEVVGRVSLEDVRDWYRRAKVYAHPSLTEGMPNTVAEAMLCECVPVGADANGTPTLIGNAGYVLEKPDPAQWATTIRNALASDLGSAARERIVADFHTDTRCRRLVEIVSP